jgi:hypothetical protein
MRLCDKALESHGKRVVSPPNNRYMINDPISYNTRTIWVGMVKELGDFVIGC